MHAIVFYFLCGKRSDGSRHFQNVFFPFIGCDDYFTQLAVLSGEGNGERCGFIPGDPGFGKLGGIADGTDAYLVGSGFDVFKAEIALLVGGGRFVGVQDADGCRLDGVAVGCRDGTFD